MKEPEITQFGMLDIQVCVPADYTDTQVKAFADEEYPCGTEAGWLIRKTGDPMLGSAPERAPCLQHAGCVHIMLDA